MEHLMDVSLLHLNWTDFSIFECKERIKFQNAPARNRNILVVLRQNCATPQCEWLGGKNGKYYTQINRCVRFRCGTVKFVFGVTAVHQWIPVKIDLYIVLTAYHISTLEFSFIFPSVCVCVCASVSFIKILR